MWRCCKCGALCSDAGSEGRKLGGDGVLDEMDVVF